MGLAIYISKPRAKVRKQAQIHVEISKKIKRFLPPMVISSPTPQIAPIPATSSIFALYNEGKPSKVMLISKMFEIINKIMHL